MWCLFKKKNTFFFAPELFNISNNARNEQTRASQAHAADILVGSLCVFTISVCLLFIYYCSYFIFLS